MRPVLLAFFAFSILFAQDDPFHQEAQQGPPSVPSLPNTVWVYAVFSNGTPASQVPVVLLLRSEKSDTIYRAITDYSGGFVLFVDRGSHQLDALIDFPSTSGIDFAATEDFAAPGKSNLTVIFYPAGSLAGRAASKDSPVPQATISVSCPSSAFNYSRINGGSKVLAGEAGEFLFKALPAGSCLVSAYHKGKAGSQEASIVAGETTMVSIEMGNKSSEDDLLLMAIVGLAAAFGLWLFLRGMGSMKASKQQEKKENKAPAKGKAAKKPGNRAPKQLTDAGIYDASSPKATAVLSTLSEREREIVLFLMRSGGRAKRSQIQHKLLIPKTSLLRNLRSLERKNIVKLHPFGRNLLAEINGQIFR
ncbi:MAG: hypothetical protein N3F07_00525 [Candidatus Micrarchaeota archaeon]|nr:hypothetical protein [Candidatus Micrarchaeota archaeon]